MTPQELLASLAQLEQELQSIKSARVLAEETIQAYNDVKKDISTLINEFATVTSSLNSLAHSFEDENQILSDEIQNAIKVVKGQLETLNTAFANQCNSVILKFMESINSASESLKSKTETLTSTYESHNNRFKSHIDELDSVQNSLVKATESVISLKTDIANLQKELDESQKVQDETLEKIAKNLAQTGASHTEILNKIAKDLKTSQDAQDDDLAEIKNALANLGNNLNSAISAIKTNEEKLDRIIKNLNTLTSIIETRVTNLEQSSKEISSSCKMSKTLIIINIIASLLTALFVLLK